MYRSKQHFFWHPYFPLFRLFVAVVMSLMLMFLDSYYHSFDQMKARLAGTVNAVVAVISWPFNYVHQHLSFASFFPDVRDLQTQIATLQAAMLNHTLLEKDIASLRALLHLQQHNEMHLVAADILYDYRDPWLYAIAINKGSAEGVMLGDPVVNARGVVGQVVVVSDHSARVRLSVHPQAMIPVAVLRTQEPAVLGGMGDGHHLSLRFMQSYDDLVIGDILVTSGLGHLYPRGVPVGVVQTITRTSGHVSVMVQPDAQLQDGTVLFVVKQGARLDLSFFVKALTPAPAAVRPVPISAERRSDQHAAAQS